MSDGAACRSERRYAMRIGILARWSIAAVGLAISCSATALPATTPGRPNVVFFLGDDIGFGDLACHGNRQVKTPVLDSFAKEAVEFTSFHMCPVCAPTRASLMTGRYNFRTGIADVFGPASHMDPSEITVAQVLRKAGYATGIFGKWHLGDPATSPKRHGFDESLTFYGPGLPGKFYFDPELFHNGIKGKYHGYCMDIFTDAAIDFLKANRSRPFFLYLPANLIHVPLVVDPELTREYDAMGVGDTTAKVYGMIRSVDNNFGRLRKTLKELGLEDNTLLVFSSDNGPCCGSKPTQNRFMDGLHGLKGTVYENGIRVPCFMRWPAGFHSPAKINRLAAHIDFLPTVLDACNAPLPKVKVDGMSLMPLLRDPAAAWPDRTLFFQWDSGQVPRRGSCFAVLTERWKLVQPCGMDSPQQKLIRDTYAALCLKQGRGQRTVEGPPRYELYDIAADRGEWKDVAAKHPEIVERMRKQYEQWFDEVCNRWQGVKLQ